MEQGVAEGGPDGAGGAEAPAEGARTRTLRDLLVFPKTRKLFLIWVPLAAVLLALAAFRGARVADLLLGIPLGVFGYSLIEYLVHRFVYHRVPQSRLLRWLTADVAREHMGHHADPGRYGGSINGDQGPIAGFAILLALATLATPFPDPLGLVAIAAGGLNYMVQEYVHFGTHQMPMRHPLLAIQKRHHMLHHHRDEDANFGLFWPFWDYVFRTDFRSVQRRKGRG